MVTEETALKGQIKDYLKIKGIHYHHLLQGIGSYKGLPDMEMFYKGRVHYLEIKRPLGKLSPHQYEFMEMCEREHIHYMVVRSLDDLMDYLEVE